MGRFVKGDVVVLPFPFSNLAASKRRPALVIAPVQPHDDLILCMITSRKTSDASAVLSARGTLPAVDCHKQAMFAPIGCLRQSHRSLCALLAN
jgi:hypothetical protein